MDMSGWDNRGICFMTGLLNAAFAVGTPDCQSHLAEEINEPEKKVPLGVMIQIGSSFVTAFAYLIALFYSINDSRHPSILLVLLLLSPLSPVPILSAVCTDHVLKSMQW